MERTVEARVTRLTTAENLAIAHIWQNRLSDEGIDCEVVGDFLGAGLGGLPGAGPELWVREDQVERARKILAQHLG